MTDLLLPDVATSPPTDTPEGTAKPVREKGKGKGRKAKAEAAPAGKDKPIGSDKAIETMFRNAIRSELDLIALAATKANIMISLNGFIISALMISGAFLFNSTRSFLIPAAVFMLTSAASIVFALLAASPERSGLWAGLGDWLREMRAGRARFGDLRRYIMRGRKDPAAEDFNLLIYDDRVRLTPEVYWTRMQDLLRNRDEIYRKMSDQLYWLGEIANRKFKLLNVSYTIFRWGLLLTLVVFFTMKSTLALFPSLSGTPPARLTNLGINTFADIYEPSAVQQLPDGRLLVVEDEAARAFSLLSMAEDGTLREDSVADLRLTRAFGRKLSDLEGLSIDDAGRIYAITSHSSTASGERRPDREQLLRFEIAGGSAGNIASVTNLRDALAADAALTAAITSQGGAAPDWTRLNIEGLAYWREAGQLLLGLREPMAGTKSVIVPILNPDDLFAGAAPRFGAPVLLDLQGGGIRALSFDQVFAAFVIVNEIEGPQGNKTSQMWRWSGVPTDPAEPIALPDIINLNNVESIDSITVHGEPRLLIMSDEGNEKKNRPAKYMMLDYGQLPVD